MTSPTQFQKIRHWVHELIELDTDQRTQRLAEIRLGDAMLADEVAHLLARIEPADLLPPVPGESAVAAGRRIGPFELLAEIGAGGMGLVYAARRVDGSVEQRVAIKLPGRSLLSPTEMRRLKRERDLLARLEHPNIARLVDAGNEPGIGPWFAMEFVDGVTITRYADTQRLSIRARLLLWLQLADAVTYAHRHLIVHRDLKPANVLVDDCGRVKLLDFGVANLFVAPDDTAQSIPAFTPRYASPEQIAGAPVTTATDVHGLGLVLFELLCGSQAFSERGDLALRQAIATTEAPMLRHALGQLDAEAKHVAAQARALTQTQWLRALGGELEAIVAKSLRKLPGQRYASVAAFAEDIERHLRGEKVHAMVPTLGYRMLKLVRRHRLVLIAACLVFAALGLGLVATMSQRNRALAAEAVARLAESEARAENGLLADILGGGPDTLRGGADMRVRDLLRSSADVVAARPDLAPASRARLLHTLAEGLLSLLEDGEAEAVLARAERTLSTLPGSDDLRLRIQLKRSWIRFEHGAHDQAIAETSALWPRVVKAGGPVLLEALQNRAHFHSARRQFEPALAELNSAQVLALVMRPLPERDLSQIRYNRIHLLMNLERNEAAYELAVKHLAIADAQPSDLISARISATEMFARAASKVDRFEAAQQRLLAILPAAEKLYQGRGNRLAGLVGALASAYRAGGRMRDAARMHHRQAELRQQALPGSLYVASALRFEGISLRVLGDTQGALPPLLQARALFEKLGSVVEVLHCDLHIAAARADAARDAKSLYVLIEAVARIVEQGEPSDRVEAPMLAIAAALDIGATHAAMDHLKQLQQESTQQTLSVGTQTAIVLYAAEVAAAQGQRSDLPTLAARVDASGNALLRARIALLRARVGNAEERAAGCSAARNAWLQVDPQALAWSRLAQALGCRATRAATAT